jgi:hypothetical protein
MSNILDALSRTTRINRAAKVLWQEPEEEVWVWVAGKAKGKEEGHRKEEQEQEGQMEEEQEERKTLRKRRTACSVTEISRRIERSWCIMHPRMRTCPLMSWTAPPRSSRPSVRGASAGSRTCSVSR